MLRGRSGKISVLLGAVMLAGAVTFLPGGDVRGQTDLSAGKAAPATTDKQRIARLEAQVRRQADQMKRLERTIERMTPSRGNGAMSPGGVTAPPDNSGSLNAAVSDATRGVADQRSAVTRLEQSVQRQEQSVSTVLSAVSRLESRVNSLENRVR